jgi:hypothetical protein
MAGAHAIDAQVAGGEHNAFAARGDPKDLDRQAGIDRAVDEHGGGDPPDDPVPIGRQRQHAAPAGCRVQGIEIGDQAVEGREEGAGIGTRLGHSR